MIAADAVTAAKIADDAIDSEHYTDASIDNAHLADDAVDSDELAAGAVDIAHLSASGSASSSTFLRGDNSWTAVTVPTEADQDNMEDEDTGTYYVAPDMMKYAPGVAIAHLYVVGSDGSSTGATNGVSATSRVGVGNYRGTYTTAISANTDANGACTAQPGTAYLGVFERISTTVFQLGTTNTSGAGVDGNCWCIVMGDHAD